MTSKKKKDPKIIREGDYVKIIKPDIFIRCGYPMDFKEQTQIVLKDHINEIREFTGKLLNVNEDKLFRLLGYDTKISGYAPCEIKIAKAIAYVQCKQKGFGGSERKIYTEYIERFLNIEGWVDGIRFVRTGIYYAPSGGYSYDGEYDYDPGGLDKEKTHKILTLQVIGFDKLEIESINVIKIKDGSNEFNF